jgi:hypothetical protein
MGTKGDENCIGGDGEYLGDRIDVFYHEASGGRYLQCGGVLRRRCVRVAVNYTRGQNWAKGYYKRVVH